MKKLQLPTPWIACSDAKKAISWACGNPGVSLQYVAASNSPKKTGEMSPAAWGEKASTKKLALHSYLAAFALSLPSQNVGSLAPAALFQEHPR